ncbi:hypothetical protein ACMBCM_08015, partial [Spiroplasma sp. K1]
MPLPSPSQLLYNGLRAHTRLYWLLSLSLSLSLSLPPHSHYVAVNWREIHYTRECNSCLRNRKST